jgi:hypothetical protein
MVLSVWALSPGSNGRHPVYSLFASVVYLTCVMRTHSYKNSVAITRTKFPFVEEVEAYWEMNKKLILYMFLPPSHKHVSASPAVMVQNLQDWPFYLLLDFTDVSIFFVKLILVIWSLGRN